MDEMNIASAQYVNSLEGDVISIEAVIDGSTVYVPLDLNNKDYAEIQRQVAAGTLTIQDAD